MPDPNSVHSSDAEPGDETARVPRKTRRIGIVEDDAIMREHLIEIISEAPDLDLAGAASTLARGRALMALDPDLYLLDIGLPDGSGLDLAGEIKDAESASGHSAKVLILTSFGDRRTVMMALQAGADGYLLKDSSALFIRDGIEATLAGGAPVSPAAASFLLEHLRNRPAALPDEANNDSHLTPREAELLTLFARGLSYKLAARELNISPLTVGNHVKAIYRKLEVHSRGEAVYEAVRSGQLSL